MSEVYRRQPSSAEEPQVARCDKRCGQTSRIAERCGSRPAGPMRQSTIPLAVALLAAVASAALVRAQMQQMSEQGSRQQCAGDRSQCQSDCSASDEPDLCAEGCRIMYRNCLDACD